MSRMTEDKSSEDQSARLSEEVAHRVLARAIELDETRDSETTVRVLRDAAQEAGISLQAFDAAVRELAVPALPVVATQRGNPLQRLWTRMRGNPRERRTIGDAVVSNAIAAAVSWVSIFLLTRIAMGLGWQGIESGILLGCVLGVGIARKLHARVIEMGLMGMVAFQAAELAMHLLFGIRAVQSGPTHFAVMIAGVLGVVLAWSASGSGRRTASVRDVSAATSSDGDSANVERARGEPNAFVRLVWWTRHACFRWHACSVPESHRLRRRGRATRRISASVSECFARTGAGGAWVGP
jgi:hypothetical protein